uniref:DUF4704 domain-containing protein n=1 Tax=Gongylonema pulchrum TaxID=637853 RepID=A0A183DTU7_9BILA
LNARVLENLIGISKYLLQSRTGTPLLKHLFDYILFNPELWSKAEASIQIKLYYYLASDFLSSANLMLPLQRCATVVEVLHAVKMSDIVTIRAHLLTFVSRMICMVDSKESELNRDSEFNALLNFIATDDNLYDVLALTTRLLAERPATMVPAFDRKRGLVVVFKLINSVNELIRIPALKIFGYFLCRSTLKSDDNLYDVLALTTRLLAERPATMVPAFDRKRGLVVVFKLINSVNELIRIPALKIFGYFLCRSTLKSVCFFGHNLISFRTIAPSSKLATFL